MVVPYRHIAKDRIDLLLMKARAGPPGSVRGREQPYSSPRQSTRDGGHDMFIQPNAVKKPPMVESKINAGDLEELFDKKP
jgi:hypothetical protein